MTLQIIIMAALLCVVIAGLVWCVRDAKALWRQIMEEVEENDAE